MDEVNLHCHNFVPGGFIPEPRRVFPWTRRRRSSRKREGREQLQRAQRRRRSAERDCTVPVACDHFILNFVDTTTACLTVDNDANRACAFPFIFGGESHKVCITDGDPLNVPWCSTETDEEGRHVEGKNKWGHCDLENCPVDDDVKGGEDKYEEISFVACTTSEGKKRIKTPTKHIEIVRVTQL